MKKTVILSGGTWSEREIALKSAEFFKEHMTLEFDFYVLPEEFDNFYKNKDLYHTAIPIFHGEYGEDGKIFAFLELLGINTLFSPYDVHAFCLDKYKTNILAQNLWVKIPKQYLYQGNIEITNFPCIVKPNHGGSSFFTYKVESEAELLSAIKEIQTHTTDQVLIQEFITWDEVSAPIVHGEVLPIMSLIKKNSEEIFDYSSKYENQETMKEEFDILPVEIKEKLKMISEKIFVAFWCKDIARIDFIIHENIPYFLEINTIPWMTKTSILPQSWRKTGKTNTQLIQSLLNKHVWK